VYKAGNISDSETVKNTVENTVKATINGLYKVMHWLSIAVKMYDFKLPLTERDSRSLIT